NLMDNACKWARGRIAATSRRDDGHLTITIEDDGPGLPSEQQGYALAPGARFDEKVPGTGLGLAIVRDLAALYNGSIQLGASGLGAQRGFFVGAPVNTRVYRSCMFARGYRRVEGGPWVGLRD